MYLIIVENNAGGHNVEVLKQLTFTVDSDEAKMWADEATENEAVSVHLIHFPNGMNQNTINLWEDGMVELENGGETLFISYDGKVEPK